MPREFPDNSKVLFGRELDLANLLKRSQVRGITAVVGRAQIGKTWLLTELARRLSQKPVHFPPAEFPSLLRQPPCLVGFFESFGETGDLLLRAVVDLYSRWLSDSSYWHQARVIFQQQRKDLVGRAGEAVGTIFKELSRPLGTLVKETIEGLASANRDLQSGGIQPVSRLQIEDARDLLELVHKITNRSIVLIFDQWEKSRDIEKETNVLDSFLRHVDEWPPCHMFVALHADEKLPRTVKGLVRRFRGTAELYELQPMHLEEGDASAALLQYVRAKVSVTTAVSDEDLLDMISGYPGTVAQWINSHNARRLTSRAELQKVADDAHAYRFAEFEDLLPGLSDSQRLLSIRLALLPATGDAETWNALRNIVLEKAQAKDLDALKRIGVIESTAPPSYGHAKRAEAAGQWFVANSYEELREICEALIFSLAEHAQDGSAQTIPYVSSLVDLNSFAAGLTLSNVAQALCESALSLFEYRITAPEKFLGITVKLKDSRRQATTLLAMGLANALVCAQYIEEALERRDALLEELQQLAQAYPHDAVVRESLANGLSHVLIDVKEKNGLERRDALLEELRQLAQAYPHDATVREQLAIGLGNTVAYAMQEEALVRCYTLLEELRLLVD